MQKWPEVMEHEYSVELRFPLSTANSAAITSIWASTFVLSRRRPHEIRLETRDGEFSFGQYLSPAERNWLVDELADAARVTAPSGEAGDVGFDFGGEVEHVEEAQAVVETTSQ